MGDTIATYNTLPNLNKEEMGTMSEVEPSKGDFNGLPRFGRKPAENETVWFWVDDGIMHIHCMIYDRGGWHLGWWSGCRWHSYFDKGIKKEDSKVKCWLPLRLPELSRP